MTKKVPSMFDFYSNINNYKSIERASKKGLLKDIQFIGMNLYEWSEFSKFFLDFDKEISKSTNIRIIILLTTQFIEYVLDQIISRMYGLNKYKKVDAYQFLSLISLRNKIEFIKNLKKNYKEKRPPENRYRDSIQMTANLEGWKTIQDRFGDNFSEIINNLIEEINRKRGLIKPEWATIYTTPPNDDYLDDELVEILQRIEIEKLHLMHDLRNDVSHSLVYHEKIMKRLKTSKVMLRKKVVGLCKDTLKDIIGFELKS